jgi:hypothetical protein
MEVLHGYESLEMRENKVMRRGYMNRGIEEIHVKGMIVFSAPGDTLRYSVSSGPDKISRIVQRLKRWNVENHQPMKF